MDPPLINETSFLAANPSSYTLAGIWPFPSDSGGEVVAAPVVGRNGCVLGPGMAIMGGSGGAGFGERDGSVEESTVTEQSIGNGSGKKRRDLSSEDESSKMVSTTTSGGNNDLSDSNGKRMKVLGSKNENNNLKAEVEGSSAGNKKPAEQSNKPSEPPKDYIHVRARRGQATDSHSLAERARREKISERMKILQDLVPGCNKVIGKALVLDEIINYIQSLQHQVEFLSMKLEAVNSRLNMHPTIDGFYAKDFAQTFDATGLMFGPQATCEYAQGPQPEWLHMQAGGSFERAS